MSFRNELLPHYEAHCSTSVAVRSILTLLTTCGVTAADTTRKLLATGLAQAWHSWQWTAALEPWMHELEQRVDMFAITKAPQSGGAALLLYTRRHALVPGDPPGLTRRGHLGRLPARQGDAPRRGRARVQDHGSCTSWRTTRTYRSSSTSRRCPGRNQ